MAIDILVVEDESDIRAQIAGILDDNGYASRQAGDEESALDAVRSRRPGLVILDIWLGNKPRAGLELLRVLKTAHPNLPVIMISGHGTVETAVQSMQDGADSFIEKPFKSDHLLLVVRRSIEAERMRRENAELRQRAGGPEELIGSSAVMGHTRQTIEKLAPTGSRSMITGPAGVGKEVVARMIHNRSKRANEPFIVLNCATTHSERLEEMLFGVDGSGQGGWRTGLLESAHGGTLLLDEVADLPIETQAKLVRILQDQRFERIGSSRSVEVDVRVLSTSGRDLRQAIARGAMREDLYYRLCVVPVSVPPLSERRSDIPELIEYFMSRSAETTGLPARQLATDAVVTLQSCEWPGNVRQLRNLVDWLVIMAPGSPDEPVRADALPPDISAGAPRLLGWENGHDFIARPLREAREMFEREYLMAQISRFGGNISRTASFVGMERSALHRKLKSLGLYGEERQASQGTAKNSDPLP